jgi:DNA-binding CsgD family transcriptional regulator
MFLYIALGEASRWNSIFKLLVPCIAVAIFCIPLMDKEAYAMSALCVITGFILFECMMWIYFGFIAQKFNLAPILVYGVGRGVLAIFSLLGTMFCELDTITLLGLQPTAKMSAVLVILTIAYIALPDREAIGRMRKKSLVLHDSFDDMNIDFDEIDGLPQNLKICNNCVSDAAAKISNAANSIGEGEVAPSTASEGQQSTTVNSTADTASRETHPATIMSADTPHLMQPAEPTHIAQQPPVETAAIDRIPQQIEVIANTYLLSRREIDVLACLARGHNASYICKHLYIAEGTAKTHIRHIYRKLNVHSQHELIELVEQIEI